MELSREVGDEIGHCASNSVESARKAFLYAMVWGFGPTNYGAWRARVILSANTKPYEGLLHCSRILDEGGASEGYRYLANEGRLKGLGPAFATKYLYFCSANRPEDRALILDRLVADWLARSTDLAVDPTHWSTNSYIEYLDRMRTWSATLGMQAAQLEALLFEDEKRRKQGIARDQILAR